MVCVREHINGLDCCYAVILAKNFKVTGLGCRIAADINHPFRGSIQDDLRDIRVDSGPWGIEYHHIRSSMLLIPFASAFMRASAMASGTYSIPNTFDAFPDTNWAIVPVPV